MSCSRTQQFIRRQIRYCFLLPRKQDLTFHAMETRKQDLTFHAMETVCMKCKSCFLGRMRKIFQKCRLFNQSAERYGLHKQAAHESVHGKTYNKTFMKRQISLHISSLIRAFANRMYLPQSLGLTKCLVRRAKTRVSLPNCTF